MDTNVNKIHQLYNEFENNFSKRGHINGRPQKRLKKIIMSCHTFKTVASIGQKSINNSDDEPI